LYICCSILNFDLSTFLLVLCSTLGFEGEDFKVELSRLTEQYEAVEVMIWFQL